MSATLEEFGYGPRMERQRLGWTLMALAVMAAPQMLHFAPWISACAVLLALWRLAGAWRGWKMPGRNARIALSLAAFAGVLFTFRTLNGPEAGTSLLLLLTMLKLMEARGLRDYFLLIVIAYFLGIANFFYDQNIPLALYMLPAVWLTTTALLNVAHPDAERRFSAALKSSGRLLLPAIPAAVVLFLLFPRMPGPLWGIASLQHSGVTGLSTSMSPGDLSQLAQSSDIAFHVKFSGRAPPLSLMYWRALVLHDYDGTTWSAGNLPWLTPIKLTPHGPAVDYEITLEPNNLPTLYALDLPAAAPQDAWLTAGYEIDQRTPVNERKNYQVTSYTSYDYGSDMPRWMLHRDLELPAGREPRARELAAQWRTKDAAPLQIVNDALEMFHSQPFAYTLQPGTLTGRDRIDQFLFRTRRGFCEHYAGAFVFLMRAAGIPAHVVIGYQGGELNPLDDYYVVRQQEAHAWAEVWIAERGWVRIDPTAAVDPARVDQGLAAALRDDDPGLMFDAHPWLGQIRNAWDAANNGWNQWVLAYGPELQEKFFSHIGLEYGNWAQLAVVLLIFAVVAVFLLWLYLNWDRRPPRLSPVMRDYRRFCQRLAKLGLPRGSHEGPLDYAARVARARPDLGRAVRDITSRYIELRYIERGDAKLFSERVRTFRPASASRH